MGWKVLDTKTIELLSQRYGLRSCEILDKKRYQGANENEYSITLRGKGNKIRIVHLLSTDWHNVVDWYKTPNSVSYSTLWRRIGKTHEGRRRRYEALPQDASFEDAIALGEELGHTTTTAMKFYNRKRIEDRKRALLEYLPK